MIVLIDTKSSNGDVVKRFGGVRCDVEGCDAHERQDPPKNLIELGWFVAPGRHRCPAHYHEEVPGRGVDRQVVDQQTGKRI